MRAITMGLTCLDIINDNKKIKINLGGTAGNVASVLSSLGIEVYDFVPDYSDEWNEYMQKLLQQRNVRTVSFTKTKKVVPKIIEVIDLIDCNHHFYVTCPKCGKKLNEVVLPTIKQILNEKEILRQADILFTDRLSDGISKAIEIVRNNQGLTIYEPNVCRFYNQLLSSAGKVDIVKFSNERILDIYANKLKEDLKNFNTKLIINSLGRDGVRYSIKNDEGYFGKWIYLDAILTNNFVDASGAGDWLTAAFIYYFFNKATNKINFSERDITEALMSAQNISSFVCGFTGAQEIFDSRNLQISFKNRFNLKIDIEAKSNIVPDISKICDKCYNKI